jgi:hypothetical protein
MKHLSPGTNFDFRMEVQQILLRKLFPPQSKAWKADHQFKNYLLSIRQYQHESV